MNMNVYYWRARNNYEGYNYAETIEKAVENVEKLGFRVFEIKLLQKNVTENQFTEKKYESSGAQEASYWELNEFGNYYSQNIYCLYLGDKIPKYHILKNPEGDGWVIGMFYPLYDEYVPLEEDGEETKVFASSKEAMDHVEKDLEKINSKLNYLNETIKGFYQK